MPTISVSIRVTSDCVEVESSHRISALTSSDTACGHAVNLVFAYHPELRTHLLASKPLRHTPATETDTGANTHVRDFLRTG
jgi:hypothetical protein